MKRKRDVARRLLGTTCLAAEICGSSRLHVWFMSGSATVGLTGGASELVVSVYSCRWGSGLRC